MAYVSAYGATPGVPVHTPDAALIGRYTWRAMPTDRS
jgi:hypothetical protein